MIKISAPKYPSFIGALLILLLGFSGATIAQTADQYLFAASPGNFNYIVGGTVVPGVSDVNLPPTGDIPIGFQFNFAGTYYDTVVACNYGWLSFNNANVLYNLPQNDTAYLQYLLPGVFPLWSGLNGSTGTASYITTGTAPNRIFIFEWRDWKIGFSPDKISFQVRLFETSNIIKFAYKQETPSGVLGNASIGICSDNSSTYLSLDNASQTPHALSSVFTTDVLNRPAIGQVQVYTFTPPTPCSGIPDPGNIATLAMITSCYGQAITLVDTGYSLNQGISFQWQSSSNGINWNNMVTDTDYFCHPVITSDTYFRLGVSCVSAPGQPAFSSSVHVTPSIPVYNSIPYVQDFENWVSDCGGNLNMPGIGWLGTPIVGNNAWRREDQGVSGFWTDFIGGYWPSSLSGLHSARFHSSKALKNTGGNLDLYLDCSGQPSPKGLYFYFINDYSYSGVMYGTSGIPEDSLAVDISTNGGLNFSRIAGFDTAKDWKKVYVPLVSSSPNTIVRFKGQRFHNTFDIGLDSVYIAPPCAGIPVAGTVELSGGLDACPGSTLYLKSVGASMSGDLTYQWEYAMDNSGIWNPITGANNLFQNIGGIYDTTSYRLKVTCNGSGLSAISNIITVNIAEPSGGYASLPFVESFETWINRCDSNDVPHQNGTSSWVNNPSFGGGGSTANPSFAGTWRREDQGITGGWGNSMSDMYTPLAIDGSHSARFRGNNPSFGNLDLLLDCSSGGTKELQFYQNTHINPQFDQKDSLKIFLSIDGGNTFSEIGSFNSANGWQLRSFLFNSSSARTVIRFSAVMLGTNIHNLGLDLVKVLPACTGQAVAGSIDSVSPCANRVFLLNLSGSTQAGSLSYQWQQSSNGTSWANFAVTNSSVQQQAISSDTWFRCIVTCTASGLSDTTAPRYIQIAPFYYCYCTAVPTGSNANIGNVFIQDSVSQVALLDNGVAIPMFGNTNLHIYSNYMYLTPTPVFYWDTGYFIRTKVIVPDQQIFGWPHGRVSAFMDFNRDGFYDPGSENIFTGYFYSNNPNLVDSGYFTVPANAQAGLTGMRLILWSNAENWFPPTDPCAISPMVNGEVEDYVVKIDYAPCAGPPNAGTSKINDTLISNGGVVQLTNIDHDNPDSIQASQIFWLWQSSTDSLNWVDLAGTVMLDTIDQSLNTKTWFRLKMICQASQDTSYSNAVYANIDNTSVAVVTNMRSITIFPNPTDGKLNIAYQGIPQRKLSLTLTDVSGKQMLVRKYLDIPKDFSFSLNLSGYAKGVYLIQIDLDNGEYSSEVILK